MNATVYVNGKITDAASAAVPVFDHGFLYGEGVYETLRTYGHQPFLFDRHMERLRRSASLIALAVPFSDEEMRERVERTMAAHRDLDEAYIRILLTRGVGELTYNPAATPTPTLIIIVKPFPAPPEQTFTEGIKLSLVGIRRNHPDALNPMIKSNNLLNNALAMQEALGRGADEALMLNHDGEIVECSQSNFFIVCGGTLHTAPLSSGLLPGITREFVLGLARNLGIPVQEEALRPADLAAADEAFISGTTREVTPVVAVDDQTIGRGKPGEITLNLLTAFREKVQQAANVS
jgi:branched-chain amino acid aminotransferase